MSEKDERYPILKGEVNKGNVRIGYVSALGGFAPYFSIGNQGFTLQTVEEEDHAQFYVEMLVKAFGNIDNGENAGN